MCLEKEKQLRDTIHVWCAVRKWLLFLFLFLGIKILENFNPKIEKLVGFKIEKKFQIFLNFFTKKW
jgi:hypothetical protein